MSYQPSAFARSLLHKMLRRRAAEETGNESARVARAWATWTEGLHPAFRSVLVTAIASDGVRLHDHADALHSSMVFGFNLFGAFRLGDPAPLADILGLKLNRRLRVERLAFEFAGPTAILAEVAGNEPGPDDKFTATDVAIFVRDESDRPGVVLIEVKLSEGGFTWCGGARSRANKRLDVCDSAELFFAEPSGCYLQRPRHAKRDRRYWTIFEAAHGSIRNAFPRANLRGACPFREDAQQPMRNHALAVGRVQEGLVAFAAMGLVHHDHNPDVVTAWDEYVSMAADRTNLFRVPASIIANAAGLAMETEPRVDAWLRSRYFLGEQ